MSSQKSTGFVPRLMKVDVQEGTLFIARGNWLKFQVLYEDSPLDLSQFTRFELYGLTKTPLTSDTPLLFDTTEGNGVLYLNSELIDPAEIRNTVGPHKTILIGITPAEPNGVVLWHPLLEDSRVTINAVVA